MPLTDTRLSRLEKVFVVGEETPGKIVFVASNAWPEDERAAVVDGSTPARRAIALDIATIHTLAPGAIALDIATIHTLAPEATALLDRRTGVRVGLVIDVPAPDEVVALPDAERAAWCDQHETRADRVRAA